MLLAHYHHHTWFLHDLNLFGIASWVVLAWVHLLFPLFCYIEDNVEIKCGGGDYFWLLLGLASSIFGLLHLGYVFSFKLGKILKNFELSLTFTFVNLGHDIFLDFWQFWEFVFMLFICNLVNGIDALWLILIVLNICLWV